MPVSLSADLATAKPLSLGCPAVVMALIGHPTTHSGPVEVQVVHYFEKLALW